VNFCRGANYLFGADTIGGEVPPAPAMSLSSPVGEFSTHEGGGVRCVFQVGGVCLSGVENGVWVSMQCDRLLITADADAGALDRGV